MRGVVAVLFMKTLLKIFRYFGFFLLGVIVCALVGSTAISYWTIQELSHVAQETSANSTQANLREVLHIGASYAKEFEIFDRLHAEVRQKNLPEICSTLCNPVNISRERLSTERSSYLASYFKQQGGQALKDPLFRLRLEEISFLSRRFPEPLRGLVLEITEPSKNPHSQSSTLAKALQLEWTLVKTAIDTSLEWELLRQDLARLGQLRDLQKSCAKGLPPSRILKECKSL